MAAQVEEGPGTARIVVIATLQQGLGLRTPWGSSASALMVEISTGAAIGVRPASVPGTGQVVVKTT
jgi:hypothetical protein